MFQNFEQSYQFVLIDEKGKDDDPDDSGGRTCDGITQSEYDAWCSLHHSPSGDVWNISDMTKRAIYQQQYWLPYCDVLPDGLDYEFFDMSVNMGQREAVIILQRTLGGIAVDGHLGVITTAAIRKIPNMPEFIQRLSEQRKSFYETLVREHPKDVKFERGWLNRVDHAEVNAARIESAAANAATMLKAA